MLWNFAFDQQERKFIVIAKTSFLLHILPMIRSALRATCVVLDGRNRFPVKISSNRTRRRNDRKRLAIIQENAFIIREGRKALMRRLAREKEETELTVSGTTTPSSIGSVTKAVIKSPSTSTPITPQGVSSKTSDNQSWIPMT